MARLHAAVITDIHWGESVGKRLGAKAGELLQAFIKSVRRHQPDIVIEMGDRVSSHDADEARESLGHIRALFNQLARPVYGLLGNHDIKHLTRAENEALTGSPSHSYSRDEGGYHLVFWNPGIENKLKIKPHDIEWLRDDIAATGKPTIVFSHVPIDLEDHDFAGEDEFDHAGRFHHSQSGIIRGILDRSGKVILCMAGHRHRNQYREINGIHYFEQQALIQQWKDRNHVPYRTWSFLELQDNKIKLTVKGHGGNTYEWNARPVL